MVKKEKNNFVKNLDLLSFRVTNWIGTTQSIIFHTVFFVVIFALYLIGFSIESILLILTTAVSLEAIYLAIFIQMTVNRNTKSLKSVEEDLDELQEDVEDIQENVEDLGEDVEDLSEEDDQNYLYNKIEKIEIDLQKLLNELEALKKVKKLKNEKEYAHKIIIRKK